MTIDEAIRARLDRFNRLWLKAEGHTFEDDPKVKKEACEKALVEWEPKMKKRMEELGFKDEDEYLRHLYDNHVPFEERDPIVQELWRTEPHYSSLYDYEMGVLDDAKKIAEYVMNNFEGDNNEKWEKASGGFTSTFSILDHFEKTGGVSIDPGHSGNSAGMVVMFAHCLVTMPEMFQYMHGALAPLVGDEGYHDDRSDLPKKSETE